MVSHTTVERSRPLCLVGLSDLLIERAKQLVARMIQFPRAGHLKVGRTGATTTTERIV